MAWQLFDYYDEEGRNVIDVWLDSLPNSGWRARVISKFHSIRTFDGDGLPGMVTDTTEKHIRELVINGRQFALRVFICRGPGDMKTQITLLGGGQEKDKKYLTKRPHITPKDAGTRRSILFDDFSRRKPHEFPEDYVG